MNKQTLVANMHEQALSAMNMAYCSYSKLAVGACLATSHNNLYAGCNVENAIFSLTQCAEQNAIGSMVLTGERDISSLLIVSHRDKPCLPCGICRQTLCEFAKPELMIYIANSHEVIASYTLADLLPHAFDATLVNAK